MKSILFIRHAKSDWESGVLDDLSRPLNDRGIKDAPAMGERLKDKEFKPELILLSPAVRTNQTMDLITQSADWTKVPKIEVGSLYHGSNADYLSIIANLDEQINQVILCGHNPLISSVIHKYSGENLGSIPTCSMALLEFEAEHWNEISLGSGHMKWYDYPKNSENKSD